MSARPTALPGSRRWIASALVVISVLGGVLTLRQLLADGPWLGVSMLLVLLLAGVTASVRQVTRSRVAPSAWGLTVAVVALAVVYGGERSSPALPVPSTETLERFARLVRSGVDAVADGRIPLESVRGVELLVVTGAVAAFLLADLVAVGLGRAGFSGLVILGLWAPALVFERGPSVPVLLLGGTAYLLLLAATRPTERRTRGAPGQDGLRVLGTAAVITVLAVVIGPLAAAAPFFGALELPSTWGPDGIDGPLRLSTDLDMRSSLDDRSNRPILTYSTDSPDPGPLRMFTMTEFDGTSWHRGDSGDELVEAEGVLWPQQTPEPDAEEPAESSRLSLLVGDLDEDRLPIPIDPRSVDVTGSWFYDAERDEVLTPRSSTRGIAYVVTVTERDLMPDLLRVDGPGAVFAGGSGYLEVPESPFEQEIRDLAREVTADATTTYDRAVALQSFFRSIANFRYDTQVPPPETDDAVWDFLTQRVGYCVQYATAMTIMARTLDIPARLGVGFLPGRPSGEVTGEYVISGRQAHAWPELYFADAGWVRFEPTPATQTGAPPVYADPFAGLPVTASPTPTAATPSPLTPQPTVQPGTVGGQERVEIGSASIPLVAVVGVVAVVAVLTTLGIVAGLARHRRRRAVLLQGVDAWWAALRTRLSAHGIDWDDSTTPRQAAGLIAERYGDLRRAHGDMAATVEAEVAVEGEAALARLVAAVENERYAPVPEPRSTAELGKLVDAVVRPLVEAVPEHTPDGDAPVRAGARG